MKLFRTVIIIAFCVIGINSRVYAQCEVNIDTATCVTQNNAKQKKQLITRYDRIWPKYSFMVKPVAGLTEKQKEMRYKVGDILNSKTTIKDGQFVTTIMRKDIQQAKLPAELYYMVMKNIERENKFLASSFDAEEIKEVESSFVRQKEKYWIESKAYWHSREQNKE